MEMENQTRRKTSKKKSAAIDGRTLEIFLKRARDGRLYYRVGTILPVRKVQGQSILLLDYDTPRRPSEKGIRNRLSLANVSHVQTLLRRSPSGKGWHGIVYVRGRWDRYQRIALQSILESDPEHCALAFSRAQIYSEKEFKEQGCVLFQKTKKR